MSLKVLESIGRFDIGLINIPSHHKIGVDMMWSLCSATYHIYRSRPFRKKAKGVRKAFISLLNVETLYKSTP